MTTNALMLAANQKTSRNPVLSLTEGEVGNALNRLEELKLIGRDSFSSRAQKWRQQFLHQMMLKTPTQAVLVTLMLRGPQTLAELRSNAASLHGPPDDDGIRAPTDDPPEPTPPPAAQPPRPTGQPAAPYGHLLRRADTIPTTA